MIEHAGCNHLRSQHRHGSGRCTVPSCRCLKGPPKPDRPAVLAAAPARVRARSASADGLVLEVEPPARQSDRQRLENMLARRIEEAELPAPIRQYLWARPERLYRADFAWPSDMLIAEVQGGIWMPKGGGHNRGSGYQADLERANLAVLLGWRLLAFSEKMIRDGSAVLTIKRALTPASQIEEQQSLPTYNEPLEIDKSQRRGNALGRVAKGV